MAQAEKQQREESELIERLVAVNRVAKVVKGGRRFGFAALVVIGDGKGRVGHGHAKAKEVPDAIRKATEQAKNRMIRVPMREGRTIHHDTQGIHGSGNVILRSAPAGTGIIAGGPCRAIFEALGIQDIVAKTIGSNNPYNMINATFNAFKKMESPRQVASRRGKKIGDVIAAREMVRSSSAAAANEATENEEAA
jgi:small subunit ribosomal protein S5